MKKIVLMAALMLASVSMFAQNSAKDIYSKYSGEKGVSAVYISPSMFSMMGKLPELEEEGMDAIKELKGFYVVEIEDNVRLSKKLRGEVQSLVTKGEYELMMEANEEDEQVRIYTITEGNIIKSLVLLTYENDEATFLCLEGSIDKNKVGELIR